jgi:AcrR family transcriptional regulator
MDHQDALMALLWPRRAAVPRRGPRPTLTLDAIARAGIAAADADGLSGLTMQRVADGLGVTKMALYRYVPGKSELVALMLELGLGEPPTAPSGDWRGSLDRWARSLFVRFHEHPWSLEASLGARLYGPNELGWLEHAVAALDGTGLTGAEKFDVAATLIGHIRNLAQQAAALSVPATQAEDVMNAALRGLVTGREDRFPAVARALTSMAERGGRNQGLDFGLARILDGVELLITARSS